MINRQNINRDSPINYREVLERIGGDTEFLEDLLKIYFLEFDEKKAQIEDALAGPDFSLLQELGHSLKGASANLGLPLLRRDAAALEIAGREKNIDRAKQAMDSLIAEYRALQDYLELNPPQAQIA